MGYTPKNWIDEDDHAGPPAAPPGTPLSAVALEDLETRVTDYAEAPDTLSVQNTDRVSNTPLVGFGNTTSENLPMQFLSNIDASTVDATPGDIIPINEQTLLTGNFTGKTGYPSGIDLGFGWAKCLTGCLGDATGIDTFTGYEIAGCVTGTASVDFSYGIRAWTGFLGSAGAGTINWAESIRATAPLNIYGSSGTITNAISLRVEAPTEATDVNFSMLVDEGTARFSGLCDFAAGSDAIIGLGDDLFQVKGGYGTYDSKIIFGRNTAGGNWGRVDVYGQTVNFYETTGAQFLALNKDGYIFFNKTLAGTAASNASLYVSTGGTLQYKDAGGVSHALY